MLLRHQFSRGYILLLVIAGTCGNVKASDIRQVDADSIGSYEITVHGMNRFIAGGFFARHYNLFNPLCRAEEEAWANLLQKDSLSLNSLEDHQWMSDFIKLELRDKFFNFAEHKLLVDSYAERFKIKLVQLLTEYSDQQLTDEIQQNYDRPLYADRIFRLIGKVMHRASLLRSSLSQWKGKLLGWFWRHWAPAYRKFVQRLPRLQYDSYVAFFWHLIGRNDKATFCFINFAWLKIKLFYYEVLMKATMEMSMTTEMIERMGQLSKLYRSTPRPENEMKTVMEYLGHVKTELNRLTPNPEDDISFGSFEKGTASIHSQS